MAPHAVVVHDDPNFADQFDQRSELLRLISERLGVLPNFFRTAASAPGLIDRLWDFARSAYFDSPLTSLFKERLFVHLSRFCEVRYCIVRHVGFLIGHGNPAGDPDCPPQTIEQVVALLRRPVPGETAFEDAVRRLLEAEPTTRVGARMDCDPSLHLGSSSHLLRTETGIPKLVIRLSTLHPILASVR